MWLNILFNWFFFLFVILLTGSFFPDYQPGSRRHVHGYLLDDRSYSRFLLPWFLHTLRQNMEKQHSVSVRRLHCHIFQRVVGVHSDHYYLRPSYLYHISLQVSSFARRHLSNAINALRIKLIFTMPTINNEHVESGKYIQNLKRPIYVKYRDLNELRKQIVGK